MNNICNIYIYINSNILNKYVYYLRFTQLCCHSTDIFDHRIPIPITQTLTTHDVDYNF
jgi:hypothetical protein